MMMALPAMEMMAQAAAIRLVDCVIEGTLLALVVGLALRLSHRQSSGTRFALWFSSLMAIAAVPVLSGLWPHSGIAEGSAAGHTVITLPGAWAIYLSIAWGTIAAIGLLRVAAGLWHLHALREGAVPVNVSQLDPKIRETLENAKRRVSFCWSERVQVPTALGLLRPAIVVPRWVVNECSPDELHQILLHELSHLKRWDDWTNLAQKVVKALLFFHPAVWWIEREISLEREIACDDAVLAATQQPRAYAECLAHLAERTMVRRTLALAQAALGRVRHMSLRVAKILDGDRPRRTRAAWKPAVVLGGLVIGCVALGAREPQWIAFENRGSGNGSAVALSSGRDIAPMSTPIPASFVEPAKHVVHRRPASVTLAKNAVPAAIPAPNHAIVPAEMKIEADALAAMQDTAFLIEAPPMMVPAMMVPSMDSNTNPSETVLLVVEHHSLGPEGQPLMQIQVWRMTVLRERVPSGTRAVPVPHKET